MLAPPARKCSLVRAPQCKGRSRWDAAGLDDVRGEDGAIALLLATMCLTWRRCCGRSCEPVFEGGLNSFGLITYWGSQL